MRVIGDRVLVAIKPEPDETTTESGLILARDPDILRTAVTGLVVQVGKKRETTTFQEVTALIDDMSFHAKCIGGYDVASDKPRHLCDYDELIANLSLCQLAPFDVAVGDCVVFTRDVGEEIQEGELTYVVLRESDIIGILDPKEVAA